MLIVRLTHKSVSFIGFTCILFINTSVLQAHCINKRIGMDGERLLPSVETSLAIDGHSKVGAHRGTVIYK